MVNIYVCGNSSSQLKINGISRIDQEKIMLNFHKPLFLALEFPRGVTKFPRICQGKALFSPKFP